MDLNNITLLSVSGGEQFLNKTIAAAEYSNKDIRLKTVILSNISFSHDFIECIKIPPLDYQGYSDFCIQRMVDYIDTDFVIIFQNDGFILDYSFWDDEFLNYDYIGAPWPRNWSGDKYPITDKSDIGNGGFCLRSKKLLKKVQAICDPYEDHRPMEDALICRKHRAELESFGFKWPSTKLAAKFSVEHPIIENDFNNQNDSNFVNSFGFHAMGKRSAYLSLI